MGRDDSARHPQAEGRDHTEAPARTPGNAEAGGRRHLTAEPGKTPGTGGRGRETTGEPLHHARSKRPRPK